MNDLHWWSAVDLAAAIRGREVSAIEALEHLVARIERLDGPINAVVRLGPRSRPRRGAEADARSPAATSSDRCTGCR
jgi:amidase